MASEPGLGGDDSQNGSDDKPGGAEFKFGDFAERVKCGVGQEVCGGLCKAEWDEQEAGRNVAIGPGFELDGSATGLDRDELAS